MNDRRLDRPLVLALAVATVVAFLLRAWGLGGQLVHGDDQLAGQTAQNFVAYGWPGPTMWHHPRLRDLLVHWSTALLGANPWGLKVWSVLLGTLCVPAVGWLVSVVGGNRVAAVVAAAIVATDPLHVDFSRQAINDVYVAFFPLAAALALFLYAERRRAWILVLSGLMLGLGLASKWPAAFPVGVAAVLVLPGAIASSGSRRAQGVEIAFDVAALAVLPAALYVATFWPWFGRGHDLAEFVGFQRAMGNMAATTTGYAGTGAAAVEGYQIGAWRWFVQPVWWLDAIAGNSARGAPAAVLFLTGVGNPLTWLATLPAAGWAVWRWLRTRDRAVLVLLALFLASYVPFVVVRRPIWTNAAVIVVPFWAALVGLAAAWVWERARGLVLAWGAAALVVALLLWPPVVGWRFAPSDALVRALVPAAAFDPANHPTSTFFGVEAGP